VKDIKWPKKKFPKKLRKQLKKLKGIEFDGCEIDSITSSDFFGLEFLIYISLPRNDFIKLQGRLFRHTPNLRWLKLHGNKNLKNIGFNMFKGLQFLLELNFQGSGCVDQSIVDQSTFTQWAARFMQTCPPDEDDFVDDMENMECEFREGGSHESKGN
jgi:hypothetical protein